MGRRVFVVGVGMIKFEQPGKNRLLDYTDLGAKAVRNTLEDAKISYDQIQLATVGYVFGDSTCGQAALYEVGMTQIPILNVHNNCATGSSALWLAKKLVEGGQYDCALAVGFEKMERGSLGQKFKDRVAPLQRHVDLFYDKHGLEKAPITAQFFGQAGLEHMKKHGSKPEHFAQIALKNHLHAKNNPNAQAYDVEVPSLENIQTEDQIYEILTKSQCCPTSNGAAAAIVVSENFVQKHQLHAQAVEIMAIEMRSDSQDSFNGSIIDLVGYKMSKCAAQAAYQACGIGPNDIQVIELHDCFSTNELLTYEALGLAEEGKGHLIVERKDNTYGGRWVVNPSGGLIGKGHPLGATGVAQCYELCQHLRGTAGVRQVPNAKIALQHNIGLGGVAIVAIYKHGFPELASVIRPQPKL